MKYFRPTEPEANPYAGYQLAYEVKKLMYALIFFNKLLDCFDNLKHVERACERFRYFLILILLFRTYAV